MPEVGTELDDRDIELISEIVRTSLKTGERELTSNNETLWRQVHPNNLTQQVVSSDAFIEIVDPGAFVGTSSARYEVSTCMASTVSAEDAYIHYTKTHESEGSYAVTVEHVAIGFARVIDDRILQTGDDPVLGHAYIDLRGMPKKLQRRARSLLADAATKAGRVHPKN